MWGLEHYGMGSGMGLVWLIPVVLLVGVLYALRGRGSCAPTARDILEARYARGEIDRETFLKQRADLSN